MRRPRFSRSEFTLLLLPVAGLCYLAARSPRTGAKVMSPRTLFTFKTVALGRGPVAPLNVSGGADTRVDFVTEVSKLPPDPGSSNWEWVTDAYIVAIKSGHTHRVAGLFDKRKPSTMPIFINEYLGDRSSAWPSPILHRYWLLHLGDVPLDTGALELRCDYGYGPSLPSASSASPDIKLKQLRADRFAVVSAVRFPLRPAGRRTPHVIVSTDPLFNVRQVTLSRKSAVPNAVMHFEAQIFYRGPLNPGCKGVKVEQKWRIDGAYGMIEQTGEAGLIAPSSGGKRRYTISKDIDMPNLGPGYDSDKPLKLHGTISVENAWPRAFTFSVPLPEAHL